MTKRRVNLSIVLMLLAIVVIVTFQSYWMYKNYKEQEQDLGFRTNVLFHETVRRCQVEKIKLDSNTRFKYTSSRAAGLLNVVRDHLRDSLIRNDKFNSQVYISVKSSKTGGFAQDSVFTIPDSNLRFGAKKAFFKSVLIDKKPRTNGIIEILEGVDSVQDSIKVKEVTGRFGQAIQKEYINVPFVIDRTEGESVDEFIQTDPGTQNFITLGFSRPYTLRLMLQHTMPYILKKLLPQILFSVLLIGLTVFSFVLLLRNLIQQRKLTQLKNDFISNITHELKTPIATVSVAIEALKNFNALHDPQRTKEYLDISGNELQRLSLLVDKVLKLSMFEKQQIELKEEAFDAKQLVEEVLASMRLQFENCKAQISLQISGSDFIIKADRLHLTSVIFNLLDNALKYSRANPSIHVELAEHPGGIDISITDNGIGISAEYQKKIFDKFFRVPSGDTHNVKGYGLGLSYVAYVLQRQQGTIAVESQPGIGSRFIVKLPRTA